MKLEVLYHYREAGSASYKPVWTEIYSSHPLLKEQVVELVQARLSTQHENGNNLVLVDVEVRRVTTYVEQRGVRLV